MFFSCLSQCLQIMINCPEQRFCIDCLHCFDYMAQLNVKNSWNALVFLHSVEGHRRCHLTKNLSGTMGTLIRFDLDLLHSLGERSGLVKGRASCTVSYYVCCYSLLYAALAISKKWTQLVWKWKHLHGFQPFFCSRLWASASLKLITFIAALQMTVLCANLTAH